MRVRLLVLSLAVATACASSTRGSFESDPLPTTPAADAAATPPAPSFGDAALGDAAPPLSNDPVDVVFTADNAYAFGWGDATSLANFQSRPTTQVAGDIFNCPVVKGGAACTSPSGCGPEAYTVPAKDAPPTAYLYVVAWSDRMTTQGALGQFKRGCARRPIVIAGIGPS